MPTPPWLNAAAERSDPALRLFLFPWMPQPYPQEASGKYSPAQVALIPGIWFQVISVTEAGLSTRAPP